MRWCLNAWIAHPRCLSFLVFAKGSLMVFCMFYRKYPSVNAFYVSFSRVGTSRYASRNVRL